MGEKALESSDRRLFPQKARSHRAWPYITSSQREHSGKAEERLQGSAVQAENN